MPFNLTINFTPPSTPAMERTAGIAAASIVTAAATLSSPATLERTAVVAGVSTVTATHGGSATAEITVAKRLVTGTAPDMVAFEITNLTGFDTVDNSGGGVFYNAQYHELYYFWDFGDAYSFASPTRVRAEHKDANVGWGPWGRHVYRSTGSYTPKCTIYEPSSGKFAIAYLNAASIDSGAAGTATAAIDVANPNTTFSGTNTVFMSPSGAFTNAPSGATTVTSGDIDAVMASNIAGQEATPKRLMLNRGESYTHSGYTMGGGGVNFPTFHLVAGGDAGANPIVACMGGFSHNDSATSGGGDTKDVVFEGIDFDGGGDPTVSTTPGQIFFSNGFSQANQAATVLLHQCNFAGFDIVALDNNNDTVPHRPRHFAVADCSITDWFNAGIYMAGLKTSFLGLSLKCNPDAYSDAGGDMGAAYRGNKSQQVVHGCDIFSRLNWTASSNPGSAQGCLRINAEATEGAETYVGGCVLEGGNTIVNYTQSGGGTVGECNHICEKNTFLAIPQTNKFIEVEQSSATVRNNIFIRPEFTSGASIGPGLRFNYFGGDADVQAAPVKAYSNTFANMFYDSTITNLAINEPQEAAEGIFTNYTADNLILHSPNSGGSDLGLADTASDFDPINTGYISSTVAKMHEELTPRYAIDFDAQTAAFTIGALLTGSGGATARIGTVIDNGTTGTIYIGEVTGGPFVNDETITDGSGGSATVNGAQRDTGFTDDFAPLTGSSVIGAYTTGVIAFDDFYGNIRDDVLSGLPGRSVKSTGAIEPALES